MVYKARVQGLFLGWMIFKAKRLDEITLNMSAEREEDEFRKMGGISKGDRATVSSEVAGEPRVGCPGKLEERVFQGDRD